MLTNEENFRVRTCYKCRRRKSLSEFYKDRRKVSGLAFICKPCDLKKRQNFYLKFGSVQREKSRLDRLSNPGKYVDRHRLWQIKRPDLVRASSSQHRAAKLQATPIWANNKYIKLFYEIALLEEQRTGKACHVDHIIPLQNGIVCGLHNEFNLQVLFGVDNLRKRNKFQFYFDNPVGE